MRSARHIAIAEEYQRHDPLSTYVYSHGKDISMLAQVANDVVDSRCKALFSLRVHFSKSTGKRHKLFGTVTKDRKKRKKCEYNIAHNNSRSQLNIGISQHSRVSCCPSDTAWDVKEGWPFLAHISLSLSLYFWNVVLPVKNKYKKCSSRYT